MLKKPSNSLVLPNDRIHHNNSITNTKYARPAISKQACNTGRHNLSLPCQRHHKVIQGNPGGYTQTPSAEPAPAKGYSPVVFIEAVDSQHRNELFH